MAASKNTRPEHIIDKNGRKTTVHKKVNTTPPGGKRPVNQPEPEKTLSVTERFAKLAALEAAEKYHDGGKRFGALDFEVPFEPVKGDFEASVSAYRDSFESLNEVTVDHINGLDTEIRELLRIWDDAGNL